MVEPLQAESLRWRCTAASCQATSATEGPFGQERAVASLRLGLEIDSPGYNVFVSGGVASGRLSTVVAMLDEIRARTKVELRDHLYVHNFDEASRPRLLSLPSGVGRKLARALRELVAQARAQIPALLDSDAFRAELDRASKNQRERHKKLFDDFQAKLTGFGLALVATEEGPAPPAILAVAGKELVSIDALRLDADAAEAFALARLGGKLPEAPEERKAAIDAELAKVERAGETFDDELDTALREGRRILRDLGRTLEQIETARAQQVIDALIEDVKADLPEPAIHRHLDQLADHLLHHLGPFKAEEGDESVEDALRIYDVNIVRDASELDTPPLVVEPNPTFTNLFGTIERDRPGEVTSSDFSSVRGGSVLRADGGYLVMYARDVLLEPGVWRNLVRTLRPCRLEIQPPEPALHLVPSATKPEPIPLALKVILIGDEDLYDLLRELEDDFPKVFKVKAEFDPWTENTPENVAHFSAAILRFAEQEKLRRPTPEACAVLVEHAVRGAGSRRRIATRFGEIADLVREGHHGASGSPDGLLHASALQHAIRARRDRHALADRQFGELLRQSVLLLDVTGSRVGQINGLSVFGAEPHYFGKPVRITATSGAGRSGLVNIEREANLSGPTYDKAVLIMAGWLRRQYGRQRPIALSASVAFEQSYGEVEGDSASLAELYCLLSAIAELPLRQSLAVTGSINQLGDVQAVGGINEKIEGFFDVCAERGLTGEQGVLIPAANTDALMLEPAVLEAVRAGKFMVIPLRTVDDGLPLVLGMPAAEVHQRVRAALDTLADRGATIAGELDRPSAPPPKPERRPREGPEDPRPPSAGS